MASRSERSVDATAPAAEDVTATFCATLVDEWVRWGVTDAVVCPGSRSTPMTLALARDARLRVHVFHDERSAGFAALGIGLATGRAALVLTTSGTAAVELHPSIVEAHHAKVPLLAVTADRPPELRDVGAPQTIDQSAIYGRTLRWYCDPGVPEWSARRSWRSLASRAILEATGSPPGPVHLNLPFREPLVGTALEFPPGRHAGHPWTRAPVRPASFASDAAEALAGALAGRKGVIIAGGGIDDPESVHELAAAVGWPVLADPRSGCRLPLPTTIAHFDALVRCPEFVEAHAPEVVLRFGALPASKALGSWLASLDAWQVGVDADGTLIDPDRNLSCVIASSPGELAAALSTWVKGEAASSDRLAPWERADAEASAVIGRLLADERSLTEPAIARDVVAAVPAGGSLVVSSSMPIRDVEWYSAPRAELTVYSNRGANGIDGVVSTAVGVALATGGPTVALVGDLAFVHDTNALVASGSRTLDLVVFVVDNGGCGIFEFLPQSRMLDRNLYEQLFMTPHRTDLRKVAEAHHARYVEVGEVTAIGPTLKAALATGGVHVLVAHTDARANVALHQRLNDAVAASLRSILRS
ncbi:MAG: 2-succinyl-5-enolpyruvyl-6-hydroxy-3-cyclohexene-1-carboxylic-acid synthase [Acidimicrobiales bacterium]|nr:2-succinyl-5-enolpyruvyl-6-hydroxy-3-cyclohexene-1-carboxylic-acid synthase [Acidimicrobiales bacterium]